MKISLIICTKNRSDQLVECFNSLEKLNISSNEFEIIVVDNNSSDETNKIIENYKSSSKHEVKNCFTSKVGLGAARNCGIENCNGEIVCFTDDDCYLDTNYLISLEREFFNSEADYGMGQILLFDKNDDPRVANCEIKEKKILPKNLSILPTGLIQGANIFSKIKVFEKSGLFNEDMGAGTPFPCEDIEWAFRATQSGHIGILIPEVIVYHHHKRKINSKEALETIHGYDYGRGAYYASLIARGVPNVWDFWKDTFINSHNIKSTNHLDRVSRELVGASKYFDFIKTKYFSN